MTPNPNAPGPSGDPQVQQKSWFGRNWGWVLGLAVVLPVMCCGGFGAITYFTAKKMVQSSVVYVDVMARVAMDSRISDALGEPVEPGLPSKAEVKEENDSGTAELTIPFKGEKGSGTLHVQATKRGGRWDYEQLEMELADGTRIDLRSAPPEDIDDAPPEVDDTPPELDEVLREDDAPAPEE